MTRAWLWVTIALGAAACGHEQAAVQQQQPYATAAPRSDFAAAYDAIKSGAENTATAGKYALQGIGSGVVRVTDQTKEALGRGQGKVEDAWITTKVKTSLATTPGVKSGDVHVDTSDGIVRLSGVVDDSYAAERAIDAALKEKGVVAVDSALQYPTTRQAPQIYTPPPSYTPSPSQAPPSSYPPEQVR